MRLLLVGGLLALGGCGGGTSGTNYSDAPPLAEIVATPNPKASPTPSEAEAVPVENDAAAENGVEGDAPANAAE